MTRLELIQMIADEVCSGCGDGEDCGINPEECYHIQNAEHLVSEYLEEKL